MALSKNLISDFVKATTDDKKTAEETTLYGTIVEYNGSKYVRLDGSDMLTPYTAIPCILAVIGAVLNGVVSGFSVESIVYGAVMGLASTGLHQAFTQFIEGKNNISTEEDDADGVHDHQ